MRIAVLGPGGVGGLVAAVLAREGHELTIVAREPTAQVIAARGLRVESVMFGEIEAAVPALTQLRGEVDLLIIATKAIGLGEALARVRSEPSLVLPLLNGLDHLELLRKHFPPERVLAGTIRIESDRPEPGVIDHTSPFVLVEMATRSESARAGMERAAEVLGQAGVRARARLPVAARTEALVMWSKLVRLNALACVTSAYDKQLGQIRSTPELHDDLVGAVGEGCAVARAEGADELDPKRSLAELEAAHDTLGSSMQRDIAAGREPELDAIPGAVLRAGARHGVPCPTIERLVTLIAARAGVPAPLAGLRLRPLP
jgi:2-dehydropantoate 2-reductase